MVKCSIIRKFDPKIYTGGFLLKIKEIFDSIFVHSIVAYIIITSFSKTFEIFDRIVQATWWALLLQIIVLIGTATILSKRVTPYNQYSFKHPAKIIGNIMFILIIIIFYKLDNSGLINLNPRN
jgi:hypothetical protein